MNHISIEEELSQTVPQQSKKIEDISETKVAEVEESFFFTPIDNKFFSDKSVQEYLLKWGLNQTLACASFRFDQSFSDMNASRFLVDLFNNPNVRYLVRIPSYPGGNISEVKFNKLRCTETTMDLFDKLTENKLVIKDYIQKTYGDEFEGIEITDLIREALLKQESEHYCVFNEKDRQELLLRIFQMFLIGGSLNQYEDLIPAYLDMTKRLYKSLVTVRKDSQTDNIFIESYAYEIKKIPNEVYNASYNPQDFIYVIVNPTSRIVHIIGNRWVKFW